MRKLYGDFAGMILQDSNINVFIGSEVLNTIVRQGIEDHDMLNLVIPIKAPCHPVTMSFPMFLSI